MDNNSSDATSQVCESFVGQLPLKYIKEPRQGKSYALNTALDAVEADLFLFTDDDVDVDSYWLSELVRATERWTEAVFFGGKILPKWEAPPPKWLNDHSAGLLRGMSVCYDRGPKPRFLGAGEESF